VRPSPFCFLDEIDAALDEPNVIRFVNLLQEFGRTSQFIVISHNKKTVTGARTLLGVTMEESGVTKVIAVRLGHSDGKIATSSVVPLSEFEEEEVEYEAGTELPPEPEPPAPKKPREASKEEAQAPEEGRPEDASNQESPNAEPVAASSPEGSGGVGA
jgi:chromosome segregation protein